MPSALTGGPHLDRCFQVLAVLINKLKKRTEIVKEQGNYLKQINSTDHNCCQEWQGPHRWGDSRAPGHCLGLLYQCLERKEGMLQKGSNGVVLYFNWQVDYITLSLLGMSLPKMHLVLTYAGPVIHRYKVVNRGLSLKVSLDKSLP